MARIPEELREDTPTLAGPGVGDVLGGQFRIDAFLGRGGMGEVFKGTDQVLERTVALKLLPPTLASSKRAAKALRREAAQAIELTHRNLARIYHLGLEDDRPFLVMEFLEGEGLEELLDREESLDLSRARAILEPLAEALDHAHARGVVHRDVKPSNILIRSDGSPVLIDFGIAAEVRDQTTRGGATAASETLGTLAYMSPEQVRGKRPAPSMDVYALAATAYEMLGGEPPFFAEIR